MCIVFSVLLFLFYPLFFYLLVRPSSIFFFFFFNDTATTEIYTLSLHDALPICTGSWVQSSASSTSSAPRKSPARVLRSISGDRKSTRLNSSHVRISYAVFCLKKKIRFFNSTTRIH